MYYLFEQTFVNQNRTTIEKLTIHILITTLVNTTKLLTQLDNITQFKHFHLYFKWPEMKITKLEIYVFKNMMFILQNSCA